eukprot:1264445-Amphidinium_carterae.2
MKTQLLGPNLGTHGHSPEDSWMLPWVLELRINHENLWRRTACPMHLCKFHFNFRGCPVWSLDSTSHIQSGDMEPFALQHKATKEKCYFHLCRCCNMREP